VETGRSSPNRAPVTAQPAVQELEREAEQGYSADEITTVKTWLVATGQRLRHIAQSRPA